MEQQLLQLTRSKLMVYPEMLEPLGRRFKAHKCILLKNFIQDGLTYSLIRQISRNQFEPSSYTDVGNELTAKDKFVANVLAFLMNDPELFDVIRMLTGCERIGSFVGRLYRMYPEAYSFDWHDDAYNFRKVGLSLNLSESVFIGGEFEIREVSSGRILGNIANAIAGDAILFQIDQNLEHRVNPVKGVNPKTSFSGWFCSQPDVAKVLAIRTLT